MGAYRPGGFFLPQTILGCGLYLTLRVSRLTSAPVFASRTMRVSLVVKPCAPSPAWQFSAGPGLVSGLVKSERPPVTDSTSNRLVPQIFTVIDDDVQMVWMATPVGESFLKDRSMTLLPSWFWKTVAS